MNRRLTLFLVLSVLVAGVAVAQDLTIDFRLHATRADVRNNFFTFTGPIRYMAAEKDQADATSGASVKMSTELFQPYRVDVLGKNVLPDGLRGLFLFAVNGYSALQSDNVTISESSGVITVQYVHRGTAYRLISDANGVFSFPNGDYQKRRIGYIQGGGPQVLGTDFSSDGTAAKVNWDVVWSTSTPSDRTITSGVSTTTGAIQADTAVSESMFYWQGQLQGNLSRSVLTISGGLDAVKR